MMQIIPILFWFMITLSQANEVHLQQEDGRLDTHQESELLTDRASGKLDKLPSDERLSIPIKIPIKGKVEKPYIEPKCCNYSTTSACSNIFHYTGGRGSCIPQNETCYGKEYEGSYFCSINNLQSCKCCVPIDCAQQTLSPCAKLNGTCMGINDECNGESLTGKEFCKQDTKNETCKCCYHPDCPCGQDYNGGCTGGLAYGNMLMKTRGLCKKSCDVETPLPLSGNACNKTGRKDCKCCTDCGVGRCAIGKYPPSCMCTTNGNQCPKGYCTPSPIFAVACPDGSCQCCLHYNPGYYSINNQCDAPNDYCVRKLENSICPKGFAKVYNACESKKKNLQTRRAVIKGDSLTSCDCCKSTACSSIRDLCTGPGSYCIDQKETCPDGYDESLDCSKPVIQNGIWITSTLCKCCKPKLIECQKGCFRVGNQCFLRLSYNTTWDNANGTCYRHNNTLAVPDFPQAVSQYLDNNYGDESYWIGAHGTSNGSTIWVTGGVIGPKAPWFSNCYERCDGPNCCIDLQANIGCINHNQCLGCNNCKGGIPRTPLCSCENSWRNDDDK